MEEEETAHLKQLNQLIVHVSLTVRRMLERVQFLQQADDILVREAASLLIFSLRTLSQSLEEILDWLQVEDTLSLLASRDLREAAVNNREEPRQKQRSLCKRLLLSMKQIVLKCAQLMRAKQSGALELYHTLEEELRKILFDFVLVLKEIKSLQYEILGRPTTRTTNSWRSFSPHHSSTFLVSSTVSSSSSSTTSGTKEVNGTLWQEAHCRQAGRSKSQRQHPPISWGRQRLSSEEADKNKQTQKDRPSRQSRIVYGLQVKKGGQVDLKLKVTKADKGAQQQNQGFSVCTRQSEAEDISDGQFVSMMLGMFSEIEKSRPSHLSQSQELEEAPEPQKKSSEGGNASPDSQRREGKYMCVIS